MALKRQLLGDVMVDEATGAILTTTGDESGSDLTFTPVPISQVTGSPQELLPKTADQTQRLHALRITASEAALVEIEDTDGGVLASWNFGANGGICIPFDPDPRSAIQQTAVNKGLQIVVSAGTVRGQAIVSTG